MYSLKEMFSPSTKQALPNSSIHLNNKTMSLDTLNEVVTMCGDEQFYHRFQVSGCKRIDRHSVLSRIFKFVDPIHFTPVGFKQIGETECVFFAKGCLEFIMKIIANKFFIANPDDAEDIMKFDIRANFVPAVHYKFDHVKNLVMNLKKRLNATTNTLILTKFYEDESLEMYYPLYQPKVMLHVMSFAASYSPQRIILQSNFLRDINSIYPLNKNELIYLDLRNNMISHIDDLDCLKHFVNLKCLLLDGNPICATYHSYNYVVDIKGVCKSLEILDNVNISGTPPFRKNFLCNEEAEDLASGFIEHFFTLYDSNDRSALLDLYDTHAVMSVTSAVIPSQITSNKANLLPYGFQDPFCVCGTKNLNKLFAELPETDHDSYSFTCDIPLCTTNYASISIKGIFRERNQILHFSRNFLLRKLENEFVLINDQLFVSNPTDLQIGWSFRFPKPNLLYPYFADQYKEIENAFKTITKMNSSYSQRFLDMFGYDLKISLEHFKEICLQGILPDEAFYPERMDSKNESITSKEIVARTKAAFSEVNVKTIWETYNKHRLTTKSPSKPYKKDSSISRIYRQQTNVDKKSEGSKVISGKKSEQRLPSKKPIIKINLPGLNKIKAKVNSTVSDSTILNVKTPNSPDIQTSSIEQKPIVTQSPSTPPKLSQNVDAPKPGRNRWDQIPKGSPTASATLTSESSFKPSLKKQEMQNNSTSTSKQFSTALKLETVTSSKPLRSTSSKPVTTNLSEEVINTPSKSVTASLSKPLISTPSKSVTPGSSKPVTTTLSKPLISTPSKSVTPTLSKSLISTPPKSVTATPSKPLIFTPSKPVTTASSRSRTAISFSPLISTPSKSVTPGSSKPVTTTLSKPLISTPSKSVTPTLSKSLISTPPKSVTATPSKPLIFTPSKPVTTASSRSRTAISFSPLISTLSKSVTTNLPEEMTTTPSKSVTATSSEPLIPTQFKPVDSNLLEEMTTTPSEEVTTTLSTSVTPTSFKAEETTIIHEPVILPTPEQTIPYASDIDHQLPAFNPSMPPPMLNQVQAQAMGLLPSQPMIQNLEMAYTQTIPHALQSVTDMNHQMSALGQTVTLPMLSQDVRYSLLGQDPTMGMIPGSPLVQNLELASLQMQSVMAAQALTQTFMPMNSWPANVVGVRNYGLNAAPGTTFGMPIMDMRKVNAEFAPKQKQPTKNSNPSKTEPPKRVSEDLRCVSPPPGVDKEEYLREYEASASLKRKSDSKNDLDTKKQKTAAEKTIHSLPATSSNQSSNNPVKCEVAAPVGTKRNPEAESTNSSLEKKLKIEEKAPWTSKFSQNRSEPSAGSSKPIEEMVSPELSTIFRDVIEKIYFLHYGHLNTKQHNSTLNGLASRLCLFRQHLLYNVHVNLDKINIHMKSIDFSQPARGLRLITRSIVYIMTHHIFKKDCTRKFKMVHCLGATHKKPVFGSCIKVAQRHTLMITKIQEMLCKYENIILNLNKLSDKPETDTTRELDENKTLECSEFLRYLQVSNTKVILTSILKYITETKVTQVTDNFDNFVNRLEFYILYFLSKSKDYVSTENICDDSEMKKDDVSDKRDPKMLILDSVVALAHVITHELYEGTTCKLRHTEEEDNAKLEKLKLFFLHEGEVFDRNVLCLEKIYYPENADELLRIREVLQKTYNSAFPQDKNHQYFNLKKIFYPLLWQLMLKVLTVMPQIIPDDNRRFYLLQCTDIIVTHLQNLYVTKNIKNGWLLPNSAYFPNMRNFGGGTIICKSMIYVLSHDIYKEHECSSNLCLPRNMANKCSSSYTTLREARFAIASIERKLFQDMRKARNIPRHLSLITELNDSHFQNVFILEDASRDQLRRDMFDEDVNEFLLSENAKEFYHLLILDVTKSIFSNEKYMYLSQSDILTYCVKSIERYVHILGNLPGAKDQNLIETEKINFEEKNFQHKQIKIVVKGIMHVITHEIFENTQCENVADLTYDVVPLENMDRSSICRNSVYHCMDKILLHIIRTKFVNTFKQRPSKSESQKHAEVITKNEIKEELLNVNNEKMFPPDMKKNEETPIEDTKDDELILSKPEHLTAEESISPTKNWSLEETVLIGDDLEISQESISTSNELLGLKKLTESEEQTLDKSCDYERCNSSESNDQKDDDQTNNSIVNQKLKVRDPKSVTDILQTRKLIVQLVRVSDKSLSLTQKEEYSPDRNLQQTNILMKIDDSITCIEENVSYGETLIKKSPNRLSDTSTVLNDTSYLDSEVIHDLSTATEHNSELDISSSTAEKSMPEHRSELENLSSSPQESMPELDSELKKSSSCAQESINKELKDKESDSFNEEFASSDKKTVERYQHIDETSKADNSKEKYATEDSVAESPTSIIPIVKELRVILDRLPVNWNT